MKTIELNRIRAKDILKLSVGLNKILARLGLKLQHYRVLVVLQDAPGITPGKITEELSSTHPASTTRILDHLADAGLIERRLGTTDRRTTPTNLTEKGIALLKEIDEQSPSLEDNE